jgi:hypothetical protein
MPNLFLADMVRELSSSTGTGALALDGPAPGHRAFSIAVPANATFPYAICGVSDESQWETGEGSISPTGQLNRNPKASSAGGGLVNFGMGLKTVALTLTADWAGTVASDAAAPVTLGAIAGLSAALDGKIAISATTRTTIAATDRILARGSDGATVDLPADSFPRRLDNGCYHAPASIGVKETAPVGDVHISNPAGALVTLSSGVFTNDHAARIQYRNRQGAA